MFSYAVPELVVPLLLTKLPISCEWKREQLLRTRIGGDARNCRNSASTCLYLADSPRVAAEATTPAAGGGGAAERSRSSAISLRKSSRSHTSHTSSCVRSLAESFSGACTRRRASDAFCAPSPRAPDSSAPSSSSILRESSRRSGRFSGSCRNFNAISSNECVFSCENNSALFS